MAGGEKGLGAWLVGAGVRAVSRAAERVLADPRGQEAVARAIDLAERGRRRAEGFRERLVSAAGVASRDEYEELERQVARLRRKAQDLSERLQGGARAERPHDAPARRDGRPRTGGKRGPSR